MAYIKGTFKKYIFRGSNGYTIGLLKVNDSSVIDFKNKVVTFTGYFDDLNENEIYIMHGEVVNHPKYGEQFNVSYFELLLPDEKEHIIDFLSSSLFKGIGKNKASKIVDVLGEDCLNKILSDKNILKEVKGISKKEQDNIYDALSLYKSNYKNVMELIKIGFVMKDALKIENLYGNNTREILNNPYQMIDDIKDITFLKIEKVKSNLGITLDDIKRVEYGIIYVIENVCFSTGNTYLSHDEIVRYSKNMLMINEEIIENAIVNLIKDNKLLVDDDKYYKTDVYESEKYIADRLIYLSKRYEKINIDKYLKLFEEENDILLDEEQKGAISSALYNDISVITGGPGTGKTTIIKAILYIYQKINKLSDKDMLKDVFLLAPTGRASKRMGVKSNFPSYTIHRFLKWQKEENIFLINEENKSSAKFVIIDEVSMLDNDLFYNLLLGLDYDTKILLIGDYNQLPSVGEGQILKDIIDSDVIAVNYLRQLYRQDEASNINLFAHNIINNKIDFDIFNDEPELTFINCSSEKLQDNLKDFIITYKDMSLYDLEVLVPTYKGICGIDNLNIYIQNIVNEKSFSKKEIVHNGVLYRENDKVLHLVNSVENNVFNGDIGEIISIDLNKKEMVIDFDGNIVKYGKSYFDNFKLAYSISIHKAQGSEFSVVILPIFNEYGVMLYKKLIYTAVTRAKRRLIIIGEESALKKAILTDRDDERKTSLKNFLTLGISL